MSSFFKRRSASTFRSRRTSPRQIFWRSYPYIFLLFFLLFLRSLQFSLEISFVFSPTKYKVFDNMTKLIFGNSESFYDYEILLDLEKSDFSKCNLCNFSKDESGTSTKRDLAIAVLFGVDTFNVVNWVRTLRSTGCKCSILFFHEQNYTDLFNRHELNMLQDCGVVWCSLRAAFYWNFIVDDPRTTKYLVIQNFLEAYGHNFDRVLICDIFDSIFQKDPFIADVPKDKVAVSIERSRLGRDIQNMVWVQVIDPNWTYEFWKDKTVINSGFELGPPDKVLSLLHKMNQPEYYFARDTIDQGIVNLLYYKGQLPELWIDYEGKYFISAAHSKFEQNPDADGFIHEINHTKNTLALIHQFDRSCPAARNLLRICPQMGTWHRYPSGRDGYFLQKCE